MAPPAATAASSSRGRAAAGAEHVVVTGASSGIGRDLAKAFAAPGRRLSLVARRQPLLQSLQAELGCEAQAIEADLSAAGDPVEWLRRAEAAFGPTDVLINNAGISYIEPVTSVEPEQVRVIYQINLLTPVAAIHHVLPGMLERGRGVIVNVTSHAAISPAPFLCHCTSTKGGLGNFWEALRLELKDRGVHVVTVYPGPIATPMGERNWAQFDAGAPVRSLPEGDTGTLAHLVRRAVDRRRARVIYPRFFYLSWFLPSIGRLIIEHTRAAVTGRKTPPMPGDRAAGR